MAPKYDITRGPGVATCFPAGYDRSNLVDISSIGEYWATFLNQETGEIVYCSKFYADLQAEIAGMDS